MSRIIRPRITGDI